MATHSSILAWKILWTEDPGRVQSMGLQRVGHDWATSLHFSAVVVRRVFYGYFFSPSYVASWDSKSPHRPACEKVYYCVETPPPSQLPSQDRSLSLTLLSLFLSLIFCTTSFRREWTTFLGAWCPPPVFRSCFVEDAQHPNNLLINLWGRKWSPCSILPPSWSLQKEWRDGAKAKTTPKLWIWLLVEVKVGCCKEQYCLGT